MAHRTARLRPKKFYEHNSIENLSDGALSTTKNSAYEYMIYSQTPQRSLVPIQASRLSYLPGARILYIFPLFLFKLAKTGSHLSTITVRLSIIAHLPLLHHLLLLQLPRVSLISRITHLHLSWIGAIWPRRGTTSIVTDRRVAALRHLVPRSRCRVSRWISLRRLGWHRLRCPSDWRVTTLHGVRMLGRRLAVHGSASVVPHRHMVMRRRLLLLRRGGCP